MITLLALYLASRNNPEITAHYQAGKCYAAESEFRPNTIKITEVLEHIYKYRISIDPDINKWSWELENKIDVIEFVYEKNVTCPN
jgi:hypothetical protein